jgi:hypothetical protein
MPGFLTTADRADMLASLTASWTQTATIQRNDGADQWIVVATNVPCRGVAQRAQELVIAGEVRSVVPWLFNLPAGTDVRGADRLLVGGHTFDISATVDPMDQALIRQIRAVEVG